MCLQKDINRGFCLGSRSKMASSHGQQLKLSWGYWLKCPQETIPCDWLWHHSSEAVFWERVYCQRPSWELVFQETKTDATKLPMTSAQKFKIITFDTFYGLQTSHRPVQIHGERATQGSLRVIFRDGLSKEIVAILSRAIRLIEKSSCEKGEWVRQADIWRKSLSNRGNSQYECSKVKPCILCLRN